MDDYVYVEMTLSNRIEHGIQRDIELFGVDYTNLVDDFEAANYPEIILVEYEQYSHLFKFPPTDPSQPPIKMQLQFDPETEAIEYEYISDVVLPTDQGDIDAFEHTKTNQDYIQLQKLFGRQAMQEAGYMGDMQNMEDMEDMEDMEYIEDIEDIEGFDDVEDTDYSQITDISLEEDNIMDFDDHYDALVHLCDHSFLRDDLQKNDNREFNSDIPLLYQLGEEESPPSDNHGLYHSYDKDILEIFTDDDSDIDNDNDVDDDDDTDDDFDDFSDM